MSVSLAVQTAEIQTAYALVKASLGLEHLAASYASDALHFFGACQRWHTWPRLESLTLTSDMLTPHHHQQSSFSSPISINTLLERSARVVMKMPRLTSLELWNAGRGCAGVFHFQICARDHRTAQITWRATWHLPPLEPRVLDVWQAVVSERVGGKLRFETEILDPHVVDALSCPADAICHLRLQNTVLHPVSRWQILRETNC